MVTIKTKIEKAVDFSFMPSLKCSLACAHCMYEASPTNTEVLDIEKAKSFINTIDFQMINSFGFYGGEISVDYDRYQALIDLVPDNIPRFTITNGVWSRDKKATDKFIEFAQKNKLRVFISQTGFHVPFQNEEILEKLAEEHGYILKGDDDIIPMGRASLKEWDCGKKCLSYQGPMRLTMKPDGSIMFCNCDGVYPIIGQWSDGFAKVFKDGKDIRWHCPKLN